jgi:Na+/serine symporter
MNKVQSVRLALNDAIPDLVDNPDKLLVFADTGSIIASMAATASFDYAFTLNVILQDFTGDADVVFSAIVRWMRVNEPAALLSIDTREQAITFEADFTDQTTVDLSIKLKLTESVVVNDDGTMVHVAEPQPNYDLPGEQWTN